MPNTFFTLLRQLSRYIEQLQSMIVYVAQWLVLAMTITVCIVIVARFFDIGSTAMQESITYMHGTLFMLSMAYTAQAGGHVRVDIIYRRLSLLNQAWINLLGSCLLLLPFALFLSFITWHSALQSWAIQEASNNPGGLPLVFLLKSLAPLTGVLLSLHALSEVAKQLVIVSLRNPEVDGQRSKTHP